MSERPLPSPEPSPERISLDSLEQQLRALPPPEVPADLSATLVTAIPRSVSVSRGLGTSKNWFWIAAAMAAVACTLGVSSWFIGGAAKLEPVSHTTNNSATESPAPQAASNVSETIGNLQQAAQSDPYNADLWFKLAKTQAEDQRSAEAIASAEKAIDVARSRNRNDLAIAVEAWLRDYRAKQNNRTSP